MGDCLVVFGTVGSHLVVSDSFYEWHLAIELRRTCSLGLALLRPRNLLGQSPHKSPVMLYVWYKTFDHLVSALHHPPAVAALVSRFSTLASLCLSSRRLKDGQVQVHNAQAPRLRRDCQS